MGFFGIAAVVRDSDGSAFVTKAEFDALKNSFQKRVDNYNTSIDSKIDGAIASYLSGLRLSNSENMKIVCADWPYLECVNSDIKNELEMPQLNMQVIYHSLYKGPSNNTWDDSWFVKFDGNNLDTVEPSKINVIEGIEVDNDNKTVDTTNAYWCGTSQKVRNEIVFKGLWNTNDHTSTNFPDAVGLKFQCNELMKWRWYNNWKTEFNKNTDPIFKPNMWRYANNSYMTKKWGVLSGDTTATIMGNFTSVVEKIDVSYDLTDTKHTHILTWDKNRSFESINKNLKCYNKVSKYQSLTSAKWLATGELSWNNWADVYWWCRDTVNNWYFKRDATMAVKDVEGNMRTSTTAINQKIPTIGLLPTDLKASEIYQWDTNLKKGDSEHPIEKIRLHEGMPLVYVKSDQTVEWQPKFNLAFDNIADKVDELYIEAGYVPFSDKNNNSEKIDLDPDSAEIRIKTTGKIGNVKFKAEKDGYIWVKWYPAYSSSTDVDNKAWIATLDITANPEVTIIQPI